MISTLKSLVIYKKIILIDRFSVSFHPPTPLAAVSCTTGAVLFLQQVRDGGRDPAAATTGRQDGGAPGGGSGSNRGRYPEVERKNNPAGGEKCRAAR